MASNEWPKSVLFAQDGLQLNFGSANEFGDWVRQERAAWKSVSNGGQNWSGPVNANIGVLNGADDNPSEQVLQNIANSYRPSTGTLGRYVSRIASPLARVIAYTEIVEPGSLSQQNLSNPDFNQGRSLAAFYQVMGNNWIGIEQASEAAKQIENAVLEVNRLRASDQAVADRFDALVTKCDADWNTKIDGFEAKVALKAPRTFWQTRADQHSRMATQSRSRWFFAVFALLGCVILAGGMEFLFALPTDVVGAVVSAVTRLVLFGTILAVAVWWLRQMLRDVRMHEHFAEDAAERATMIETYAALRGAGLQDADLSPILTALYRPAAGALNEDQGPVLPTEIILKTVAAAAARGK